MTSRCALCQKGINHTDNQQPWDHILHESDHFFVYPTLGSLVPGWVLIAPKSHFICMGALDNSLLAELHQVLSLTRRAVAAKFGPVVTFEHGPAGAGQLTGCGVDHAHIHVVPFADDILRCAKSVYPGQFTWAPVSGLAKLQEAYAKGRPYLYVEQQGQAYLAESQAIPSQLFRRVIANEIWCPELFNWRSYTGKSNADLTVQALVQAR